LVPREVPHKRVGDPGCRHRHKVPTAEELRVFGEILWPLLVRIWK